MTTFWCEQAWLPGGPRAGVSITVENGRFTEVEPDRPRRRPVLSGLVLPGFANVHSHAFHRALRGRTHARKGTFWTWREVMYTVADRLDPDSYYRLARAVYAEMVLAGFTGVGEFHYLHHARGGAAYDDPNAMSLALCQAADDAGIRLTLLDTCYLTAAVREQPLDPVQRRFSDGDAERWASRVEDFRAPEDVVVGAAVHSVRAVPRDQMPTVAGWAAGRGAPLHAHVSEQRAENEACLAAHGRTPVGVLATAGALDERFVAVHGTHLTPRDIRVLGSAHAGVCFCPTTERDLGDGIGPARALADAGVRLSLGTDSHAVVDPFAELSGLELNQRLAAEQRGAFGPDELIAAATRHDDLGRPELGVLAEGAPADLVAVDTASLRTAGSEPAGVPLCAASADVRHVMVAGEWIVRDAVHLRVERPADDLAKEITELLA